MPEPVNFPSRRAATPPADAPTPSGKVFVLGVTGASGADYSCRFLEQLLIHGHAVHLVVSQYGQRLLAEERGVTRVTLDQLCPSLATSAHSQTYQSLLTCHPNKDVGAVIASGSFLHDGMVVLPCSSTTLGAIATGSGSNLLTRAAMVSLKERRPLILAHRESPLSLIDIENMRSVTLAGGVIAPTNPGLYLRPTSVDDLIDFVVGKCLDLLHIEHGLETRWGTD
ncbi:MAG: 4-hydroxy-3-polyprenylbenzoate decarboxylase [Phycisphaerales bacterium]|jgi:4-hydroxy-3-polyprenylbenzoate decarboxylase